METSSGTVSAGEKQFTPNVGQKASKAYKWKFVLALKVAIVLFILLTITGFIVGWLLVRNHNLSAKLDEAKIITIAPNGKLLTQKVNK